MKKVLILFVVLVLANAAVWAFLPNISFDDGLNKLTVELLETLEKDVNIFHVVTKGEEDENIVELLNEYTELSSKVKVQTIAPDSDVAASLYSETLPDNCLVVSSGSRVQIISSDSMYSSSQSDTTESVQEETVKDLFVCESLLDEMISYVTVENAYTSYLIGSAQDEHAGNISKALENNVTDIKLLDIAAESIPEDALCAIYYMPTGGATRDLTKDEYLALKEYLSNGGRLLLVTNCLVEIKSDAEGKYSYEEIKTPYIDSLLSLYGLSSGKNIILESDEENCFMQYDYYSYSATAVPYLILADGAADAIKGKTAYYFCAEPVVTSEEEAEDEISFTTLLKTKSTSYTDEDFWTQYCSQNDIKKEDTDVARSYKIGVEAINETNDSSLVWISGGIIDSTGYIDTDITVELIKMLGTDIIDEEVLGSDKEAVDYSVIRPKTASAESSITDGKNFSGILMLLTAIILPVAVILIGFIAVYARKSRYKNPG